MIPITQLKGEGNKAYEAFQTYLKLGHKRSMRELSKTLKKTEGMLQQWSSEFKWKERIKTYNYEQLQRERVAEDLAATALADLRIKRKAMLEANAWEMYEKFMEKVKGMLMFPLATKDTEVTTTTEKDGKIVHNHITTFNPSKWTFGDTARIMAAADTLGRMALGLPVGKHELTGANGETLIPVAAQPIFNVTLAQGTAEEEAELAKLIGEPAPGRKRGDAGLNGH
jgi:hypothetical protein